MSLARTFSVTPTVAHHNWLKKRDGTSFSINTAYMLFVSVKGLM